MQSENEILTIGSGRLHTGGCARPCACSARSAAWRHLRVCLESWLDRGGYQRAVPPQTCPRRYRCLKQPVSSEFLPLSCRTDGTARRSNGVQDANLVIQAQLDKRRAA